MTLPPLNLYLKYIFLSYYDHKTLKWLKAHIIHVGHWAHHFSFQLKQNTFTSRKMYVYGYEKSDHLLPHLRLLKYKASTSKVSNVTATL